MPDNNRLVLSTNARLRASVLCLLYFCQGFPWGFATIALVATLSAAGHAKADTATIVALAIPPWTFNFFWAPLIDSFYFLITGLTVVLPMFLLITLDPDGVAARRQADEAALAQTG